MNFLGYFLKAVYQMIYVYSCIEIFVETKYEEFEKTEFAKRIQYYMEYKIQPTKQYLFIEDGNQIMLYKSLKQKETLLFEPENYDFILCNDYRKNKNKWMNYKIIYSNYQDIAEYKVSSVSFLSFAVKYKDIVVDILLENDKYNYMIVGNRINSKFIYYLLKNMKIDVGAFIDFDYTIQILTHDVNILSLNSKQELIIGEKSVSIV